MTLALRIYRTLLRCYPAPFRHEYSAEMIGAFADQLKAAEQEGNLAQLFLWLGTICDIVATALREHFHLIIQDLRYARRALAAQPAFTAVAILSLALGIGANTAIFSLLDSVLLNTLPVRDPQSLVILSDPSANGVSIGNQSGERSLLTYTEFQALRAQTSIFSALMACQSAVERVPVRIDGGDPEEVNSRLVSPEYFETLGVSALLGRTFNSADDAEAPHAVISYDYWQSRFGRRADILGTRLAIRCGVFTIVGVAPPAFFGETVGERPDVWLPLSLQPLVLPGRDWLRDLPGSDNRVMWLHVFGRLRDGVTMQQAQAAANVTFQQALGARYGSALTAETRRSLLRQRLRIRSGATGASEIREQFAEPLVILLAAAGLVLLIACANLGNLMLSRAAARTREIAVRLALGAGRAHIVRQLLTEALLISVLGGIVGLAAAWGMRTALLRWVPASIQVPASDAPSTLAFTFAVTIVAGLILGLLPALRARAVDAAAGLKQQGRGLTASAAWLRTGKFVVVGQVALSLPLLVAAGVLLETLRNLQQVDLGYVKERLLMVRVDIESAGYEGPRRLPLIEQLLERVRSAPGVRSASYSKSGLFLGSDSRNTIQVEGYTPSGNNDTSSHNDQVGPDFFSTLGIPILRGREITARDQATSTPVCVINEAFAKRFFSSRDPLGMHIIVGSGPTRTAYRIVGVAYNSRKRGLRGEVEHRFFVPSTQPIDIPRFVTFAVRTAAEPVSVIAGVRRAILSLDPNLPIGAARPLTDFIDERTLQDRLLSRLSLAFGGVALLLAAMGIYGVLSYGVARRTNEIGIRKALGAQHGEVIRMILRESSWLLAGGLVAGAGLSAIAMRLIASRLYGVAPTAPLPFAVAASLLLAVALVASWLPAHRAARVDPLVALRHD